MSKSLIYEPGYVRPADKQEILRYLKTLFPIWEMRYSQNNPPPAGQTQRSLLRPVYWLGNWQFACLNYYHPPKGIDFRCVQAEAFPPVMQKWVDQIQERVRNEFLPKDVPRDWHLNTCLINYYGDRIQSDEKGEKKVDCARVGEHKDFEPGPVASISFGEKALIQFVSRAHKQARSQVVKQMWLEDSSLQIFGGDRYKKQLFHRIQRVEKKSGKFFDVNTPEFETRRINFTFRYVPREHIQAFHRFPKALQEDVREYVEKLADKSDFFRGLIKN